MIVTCPNCETKFNLPENKIQPGAQLRCSVCKHVFGIPDARGQMPGQTEDNEHPVRAGGTEHHESRPEQEPLGGGAAADQPDDSRSADARPSLELDKDFAPRRRNKSKSRKGLGIVFALILLIGGGAGAVYHFKPDLVQTYLPFLGGGKPVSSQDTVSKITLRGVRQYSITNEKLGMLSVIEGKAVNGFSEPRELIKVEASLFDKDGNVLAARQQIAGTQASLFQLQVLSEKDLEQTLNNKVDILTNNINVPPGGEVPFMIVFYKSPENATEFGVKVIDAKLPPK